MPTPLLQLDSALLARKYVDEKETLTAIAKELNASRETVRRRLIKLGVVIHPKFKFPTKDLTGQQFGDLKVINLHSIKGGTWWNCRCNACGNLTVKRGWALKCGDAKSCGCKAWKGCGDISGTYWGAVKTNAKRQNRPFTVSIEYAWQLFERQKGKCALSGVDITLNRHLGTGTQNRKRSQTASLDRINSAFGYISGNVQWVHKDVNTLKSNFSETDLLYWVAKIHDFKLAKID